MVKNDIIELISSFVRWAKQYLHNWGALTISAFSLFFALVSYFQSAKAQKLQNKVNEIEYKLKQYELAKIEKAEAESNSACVQARIIRMGDDNYRLKVWNSGGKTAYNVTAKFEGNSGIIIMNDEKMPFEELDTLNGFELLLLVYPGSSTKARVLTEWTDTNGTNHQKSQMVDI